MVQPNGHDWFPVSEMELALCRDILDKIAKTMDSG